jgi:hypothetical protein
VLKPEGSLAEHDFPSLVQALSERRWSGVMTLTHAGIGKSVTVQDGRMVFASSSSPDERLGELLLRRGKLTLRQFVDAGRAIAPGKRLGTILVEHGALLPNDLVKTVVEHTQEIIYGAFLWTEGHYRLQESKENAETITLKISTPDIIMEGIRRIDSWSRVDRALGGIAARYERTTGHEAVARNMKMGPERQALLQSLATPQTVEQVCVASALSDFEACQALWAFSVIGLVRRIDVAAPAAPVEEDEGLGFVLDGE